MKMNTLSGRSCEPGDLMSYPCEGSYIYDYYFELILSVSCLEVEVVGFSRTHANITKTVFGTKLISGYSSEHPHEWQKL